MSDLNKAWVYDRLSREGMLPSNNLEAEEMLDSESDNDYDDMLQRANELFWIESDASSQEAAEFIAETSYLVREAGAQAAESGTYEGEKWREEINGYIEDYFDSGEIMDIEYPPKDQQFIDQTKNLVVRLRNSHFLVDETEDRALEYLKQNFLENGL